MPSQGPLARGRGSVPSPQISEKPSMLHKGLEHTCETPAASAVLLTPTGQGMAQASLSSPRSFPRQTQATDAYCLTGDTAHFVFCQQAVKSVWVCKGLESGSATQEGHREGQKGGHNTAILVYGTPVALPALQCRVTASPTLRTTAAPLPPQTHARGTSCNG